MLDLGHGARVAGTPLAELEAQHNSLIVGEGFGLVGLPTMLFSNHLFGKCSKMSHAKITNFYHGTRDLLYPTKQAAQAAIQAENNGRQPSSEALFPSRVKFLVVKLEEWCRELHQYRIVLENRRRQTRRNGISSAPPARFS